MAKVKDRRKIVAENRKARHNYAIEDVVEAGLILVGTEVKALREGQANIAESYASVEADGAIWLINSYIPQYEKEKRFSHDERRPRKLLLHQREIARLSQGVAREGMTMVPLKMYFNEKGIAKLELGLAKGKKLHDKRESDRQKDWNREKQRLMKNTRHD
ncbi:MAG: SsrA-binding protein SmpB [Pseudomonadota bacterium]